MINNAKAVGSHVAHRVAHGAVAVAGAGVASLLVKHTELQSTLFGEDWHLEQKTGGLLGEIEATFNGPK